MSIIDKDLVLHLISDDANLDVTLTSWTPGNAGGGFSYLRSTETVDHFTSTVTVNNVPPQFDAGPDETITAGEFSRNGITFTDLGADNWTGTVNFGDSPTDFPLVINQATKEFTLSHTCQTVGTFTVSVAVDDNDPGGTQVDEFDVTVTLNTPPVAIDDNVTTDENTALLINVLADNGSGADFDGEGNPRLLRRPRNCPRSTTPG